MQVRTRTIDDIVRSFVARGGRQIVILGAGYDCRAARLATELDDVHLVEVDHPGTQARKRAVLDRFNAPQTTVTYIPWDFEARSVEGLPQALAGGGHDASRPTLTLWEGVTMYLSKDAVESTAKAVRAISAKDSLFVVNYLDRRQTENPNLNRIVIAKLVASRGEPLRFGWTPAELPGWAATYGFEVVWDCDIPELTTTLLPPAFAKEVAKSPSRIALLRCSEPA